MSQRDLNRCPASSGDLLREEILPALDRPRTAFAQDLSVSPAELDALLEEAAPVTPDLARRLATLASGSAESWLRLQSAHDAWKAARIRGS